ncbi:acyl-CoA dehydrogenase [Saccharopolyspora sp. 5N708]|uniref:acyl-CoA dehydrogenase n=1 Tax=Saccharopolyspora sp. 5N708 TaxID=3457424 RepID=UPI003FCEF336
MNEVPSRSVAGDPSSAIDPDEIVRTAEGLYGLFDKYAASSDEQGVLNDSVVSALHEVGAVKAFLPRELGGLELRPTDAMRLFRALAYADPSAGWVGMALATATGLAGAFFPEDTARELFADGSRTAIAGQGTKPGRAVPVDGGHLVSGEWSFASGIKHATHVHTAAIDAETGQSRFFVLPVAQATIIDNWDVLGLRATGSLDYVLNEVFVPIGYSYPSLSREPITGGDLYRLGIGNLASINHGSWALGVGRRLLDELAAFVRRTGRGLGESFHGEYASAEATLRSAEAFLFDAWRSIEAAQDRGDQPSVREETLNRLALNNATWSMQEVAEFVYRSAGSVALRSGVIQRLFRDVHAGTQHISSSATIRQSCGRELAGLADQERWVHFRLVRDEG